MNAPVRGTSTSTSAPVATSGSGPAGGGARPPQRAQLASRGLHDTDPALLKIGYIAGSIFIPPLAVFVKTGDACETGVNFLWCGGRR